MLALGLLLVLIGIVILLVPAGRAEPAAWPLIIIGLVLVGIDVLADADLDFSGDRD